MCGKTTTKGHSIHTKSPNNQKNNITEQKEAKDHYIKKIIKYKKNKRKRRNLDTTSAIRRPPTTEKISIIWSTRADIKATFQKCGAIELQRLYTNQRNKECVRTVEVLANSVNRSLKQQTHIILGENQKGFSPESGHINDQRNIIQKTREDDKKVELLIMTMNNSKMAVKF